MAPVQPKRPVGGAYGAFLTEKRPEYTKACAGQKASAISKMAGENWGTLSDKQKAPYQKTYEALKAQFETDLKAFLDAGGVKEKGLLAQRSEKRKEKDGKKKKKKDPNAPKRPAGGGYGVYMAENREKIGNSLPKGHSMGEVGKKAGELWRALSAAAKKPYEDKFQKKNAEFKAAMEEFKKTHPTEEDHKDDDGDDEEGAEEEDAEEEEEAAPKKSARKAGA